MQKRKEIAESKSIYGYQDAYLRKEDKKKKTFLACIKRVLFSGVEGRMNRRILVISEDR